MSLLALAVSAWAQAGTWEELNEKLRDLYTQGRYQEAIVVAQEALSLDLGRVACHN